MLQGGRYTTYPPNPLPILRRAIAIQHTSEIILQINYTILTLDKLIDYIKTHQSS